MFIRDAVVNWYFGKPKETKESITSKLFTWTIPQRNLVAEKIQEYKASYDDLCGCYRSVRAGGATLTPIMLFGVAWGIIPAAFVFALLHYNDNLQNPLKLKNALNTHKEKHKELLTLYQWIIRDNGAKATYDQLVLDAVTILAPNTYHRSDIFTQKLIEERTEICDKFYDALNKTSIGFDPVTRALIQGKIKDTSSKEKLKTSFTDSVMHYVPRMFKDKACVDMYNTARLKLFGYDSEAEKEEVASGMRKKMV